MDIHTVFRLTLPFLGAGSLAFLGYWAGKNLINLPGRSGARVASLTGMEDRATAVAFGSEAHRLRLTFARFGMNVAGRELMALQTARIGMVVITFIILKGIASLPLFTSLSGAFAGLILLNGMVSSNWAMVKQRIEREIPLFLTGLSSSIQITPSVLQAVEDEAFTLETGSPLQNWLLNEFLPRCQREGFDAVPLLTEEAFQLSSSLGIVVFLIGRLWHTGGKAWEKAFEMAVNNLEGVLDARVLGQSTGASAKGSVRLIAGITAFVIFIIVRSQSLAAAVSQPMVQIAYVGIIILMIFGWNFLNNVIDETF